MSTTKQTLHIYWQHTKPYKKQLLKIYPLMVLAQIAEDFISPILVSSVITAIAAGNMEYLASGNIALILLGVVALETFGHFTWNIIIRLFWRTQDSIMRDLSMTVFNHLSKMSYRFYSDRFAGSLVNQSNKFVGSFERLTDPLTWNVFKLVVSLLATSVILLPKAPLVVAVIWAISLIYAPLVWIYRRRQVPFNRRWAAAETKRTGQLADAISNIMAVKSFANEKLERERMQDRADEVHNRSMDTMRMNMKQELVTGAVQRSLNVGVIVFSIILAVNGQIEVGVIYLSLIYTTAIMRRLWDLNNTFRAFTRVFGDSNDMAEILAMEPEVDDKVDSKPFRATLGEAQFRDVTFWYPGNDKKSALFESFNLHIQPGEKIGLVGPSGGGKTSITKLLLRFMDIQAGTITIDGRDIATMTQADLRRSITYVPQEPLLFHRTLKENIGYGLHRPSEERIIAAAKKAHAHEFITKLPDGYDTLVGERGVKLSGGQKQRIAIARAILKDAPLLVLDEATSALDSESEVLIQDALWELMKGKTAIVIAHRLSTIQKMDRIIVLDHGDIIEEGTHQSLKNKKDGLYARLWQHQSGGFIQD